jgi:hypothetical protein
MKSKIELAMGLCKILIAFSGGIFVVLAISNIFFPSIVLGKIVYFSIMLLFFLFWGGAFFVIGLYVFLAGQWWQVLGYYFVMGSVFVFSIFTFDLI